MTQADLGRGGWIRWLATPLVVKQKMRKVLKIWEEMKLKTLDMYLIVISSL